MDSAHRSPKYNADAALTMSIALRMARLNSKEKVFSNAVMDCHPNAIPKDKPKPPAAMTTMMP